MVPLVSEEWCRPSGRAFSIVVSELGNREPTGPVVLLEITVNVEVLFQGLIYAFCLTICLWMITGGEVQADPEKHAERVEKVGDELGASVGGDMCWDSMF